MSFFHSEICNLYYCNKEMEQRKTRKSAPQDVSEGSTPSKKTSSEKTQRPEVPAAVIGKLIVFTLLMIIAPLGSYFSTITYFYPGTVLA